MKKPSGRILQRLASAVILTLLLAAPGCVIMDRDFDSGNTSPTGGIAAQGWHLSAETDCISPCSMPPCRFIYHGTVWRDLCHRNMDTCASPAAPNPMVSQNRIADKALFQEGLVEGVPAEGIPTEKADAVEIDIVEIDTVEKTIEGGAIEVEEVLPGSIVNPFSEGPDADDSSFKPIRINSLNSFARSSGGGFRLLPPAPRKMVAASAPKKVPNKLAEEVVLINPVTFEEPIAMGPPISNRVMNPLAGHSARAAARPVEKPAEHPGGWRRKTR